MSATLAAYLGELRRWLGTAEQPHGSNRQPFSAALGRPPEAWCADYLIACADKVGLKLPGRSGYTPTLAASFQQAGRWGHAPRPGAWPFFIWPDVGRIAHVGAVEAVERAGSIITLEGNTDEAGGRTGGRVMRHRRRANIAGYGYPVYAPAPAKKAPAPAKKADRTLKRGDHDLKGLHDVSDVQRALGKLGHPVTVDGDYGPATELAVRSVQRAAGIGVDGKVGPATWRVLRLASH